MRFKDTSCGSAIDHLRRCGEDGEQCERCGRIDLLRAENEVLRVEVDRLTAERDRYKAWHDDQANRSPDGWLCISADGNDIQAACRTFVRDDYARFGRTIIDLIVRPQPLKENE